jgi:hypothetical protein
LWRLLPGMLGLLLQGYIKVYKNKNNFYGKKQIFEIDTG